MARMTVRARAVDMLGRQQIAGIPTAIHELFKNAHDAYATRVEADYYEKHRLFTLRDDGYGMTREDFEGKWLALGTESRLGANQSETDWNDLMEMPRRIVMGEKGIGRLAIAVIGPLVLVATRAKRQNGLQPIVLSLIHWGLFEIPGLDLQLIDIPVVETDSPQDVDNELVKSMAHSILFNLEGLRNEIPDRTFDVINSDLQSVKLNPYALWAASSSPTLLGDGHGTHFHILQTSEILDYDIEENELRKELVGFSNTMTFQEQSTLSAKFRHHKPDGEIDELIGASEFFTNEDFQMSDHQVEGRFDEYGKFQGTVTIYHGEPVPYILPWKSGGKPTRCGPFSFSFAYVQGKPDETSLPRDAWSHLRAKCDVIGGIYIYKDGIRVLPYGRPDHDFLEIEKRRTLAAKDWVFSYRLMFGAISISCDQNPELKEKAGREGFSRNIAYRQFREILMNFLMSLAKDFFRKSAERSETYQAVKEQYAAEYKKLQKREESNKKKAEKFEKSLESFVSAIENQEPTKKAGELSARYKRRLDEIMTIDDPAVAGNTLVRLERDLINEAESFRNSFVVPKPSGFTLKKKLRPTWEFYLRQREKIEAEVITPAINEITAAINAAANDVRIAVDRRNRIEELMDERKSQARSTVRKIRIEIENARKDVQSGTRDAVKRQIDEFDVNLSSILAELDKADLSTLGESQFENLRSRVLDRVDGLRAKAGDDLGRIRDQLTALADAIREGDSLVEIADAAANINERQKEELDQYIEFAQAGRAIGIIQHEFQQSIANIKSGIERLQPWSEGTPELKPIQQILRTNFEHLDGFMKVLDPLSKRFRRHRIPLSGEQIYNHLLDVFDHRLKRHDIKLEPDDSFLSFYIDCYWSTFLPVFLNIIDNAIYWIVSDHSSERWIRLESRGGAYIISNGGPGIPKKDAERIFEFGETLKLEGRGMGLFISRTALKNEGWDITLDQIGKQNRPIFKIAPENTDETE